MKKNVLIHLIVGFAALVIGVCATVLVLQYGIYGPKLTAAEENIALLSGELKESKSDLSALQTDFDTLTSDHTKLQKDHTDLQAEYNKIAGDIEAQKKEVAKLQAEAKKAEADLAKAKKGVMSLKMVADLFKTYDKQCDELAVILDDYYTALEANNLSLAYSKAEEYNTKAEKATKTYDEITRLLDDFRKENGV